MAFIVQNLMAQDVRLQLGAEDLVRQTNFGTQWTKLRIGCRMVCQSSSAIPSGVIGMGVCQGANSWASPNFTDVFVAFFSNAYASGLGYNAGAMQTGAGTAVYRKATSTGLQYYTAVGGSAYYFCAQPYTNVAASLIFCDITKNTAAGSIAVQPWLASSPAQGFTNISRSLYLAAMESEVVTNVSGLSSYGGNSVTLTSTPTSMPWDTVFLTWNRSIPILEIHDFSVLRFY